MKKYCIYHGNKTGPGCLDGFTAYYAVAKKFGNDLIGIPASYDRDHQQKIVDQIESGSHVIVVDYCFDADFLDTLVKEKSLKQIQILDHHKVTPAKIREVFGFHEKTFPDYGVTRKSGKIGNTTYFLTYDEYHSGAYIAWDTFLKNEAHPNLLMRVQDRDLFAGDYDDTEAVIMALRQEPQTIENWDRLFTADDVSTLEKSGLQLLSQHQSHIDFAVSTAKLIKFEGHEVKITNCAPAFASDVGAELSKNHAFSMTFFITGSKVGVSLRSRNDEEQAADVAEIAKKYGGGGHKHAAGMPLSLIGLVELIDD